jgi:hypothetical protein
VLIHTEWRAVVAVSSADIASALFRLSITRASMASKAMRITDHSCGTDTWSGANSRAPNLRQGFPTELFDALWTSGFEVRPEDLGENIAAVALDLECLSLGTLLPAWRLSDALT